MKLNTLLLSLTLAFSTLAATSDITINDGHAKFKKYGTDPRGLNESGYVSQGTTAIPEYDLKAFGYDPISRTLTYVGGYDLINGHEGWTTGDLFFDTDGVISNAARPSAADGYFNYSNTDYEYAIHFNNLGTDLSYDVYKLSPNSQLTTAFFAKTTESDPYQLVIDNSLTWVMSGAATSSTASNAQANMILNSDIGTNGIANFVAVFSLSFLGGGQFEVHLTQSCGNDELVGNNPVPEASTFGAGIALLGLCWFNRRK